MCSATRKELILLIRVGLLGYWRKLGRTFTFGGRTVDAAAATAAAPAAMRRAAFFADGFLRRYVGLTHPARHPSRPAISLTAIEQAEESGAEQPGGHVRNEIGRAP